MTTTALSHTLKRVKESPTMAITAKATQMRQMGRDVISLSAGEPDFPTPAHIKKAGIDAINNNFTTYTPVAGIPDLLSAIAHKLKRDNQLSYDNTQILVSCGAKHSIYNAYQALLNPEDEVIIPAPYWVSYPDMAALSGATPVIIETCQNQSFKITPEQLEKAINEKTKLFILNSPSNPTGMVYTSDELQALAQVLLKYPQVTIISDDIYEHIVWTAFSNIVTVCPELYDRTLIINGVSKAYAMTGWRIGYTAGPQKIINAMKKIQSQSTSNPCTISQHAALAALNGPQKCIDEMLKVYQRRQQLSLSHLNNIEGISCMPTEGAFYLFPNVGDIINRLGLKDDIEFTELLLEKAEIAVVPGSGFGLSNHIRLSYATSDAQLEAAFERMAKL